MKQGENRWRTAATQQEPSVSPFAGGIFNKYKAGTARDRFGRKALLYAKPTPAEGVGEVIHVKVIAPPQAAQPVKPPKKDDAQKNGRTIERIIEKERVTVFRDTVVLRDVTRVIREQRAARQLAILLPPPVMDANDRLSKESGLVSKHTRETIIRERGGNLPSHAALTPAGVREKELRLALQAKLRPGIELRLLRSLEKLGGGAAAQRMNLVSRASTEANASGSRLQLTQARRVVQPGPRPELEELARQAERSGAAAGRERAEAERSRDIARSDAAVIRLLRETAKLRELQAASLKRTGVLGRQHLLHHKDEMLSSSTMSPKQQGRLTSSGSVPVTARRPVLQHDKMGPAAAAALQEGGAPNAARPPVEGKLQQERGRLAAARGRMLYRSEQRLKSFYSEAGKRLVPARSQPLLHRYTGFKSAQAADAHEAPWIASPGQEPGQEQKGLTRPNDRSEPKSFAVQAASPLLARKTALVRKSEGSVPFAAAPELTPQHREGAAGLAVIARGRLASRPETPGAAAARLASRLVYRSRAFGGQTGDSRRAEAERSNPKAGRAEGERGGLRSVIKPLLPLRLRGDSAKDASVRRSNAGSASARANASTDERSDFARASAPTGMRHDSLIQRRISQPDDKRPSAGVGASSAALPSHNGLPRHTNPEGKSPSAGTGESSAASPAHDGLRRHTNPEGKSPSAGTGESSAALRAHDGLRRHAHPEGKSPSAGTGEPSAASPAHDGLRRHAHPEGKSPSAGTGEPSAASAAHDGLRRHSSPDDRSASEGLAPTGSKEEREPASPSTEAAAGRIVWTARRSVSPPSGLVNRRLTRNTPFEGARSVHRRTNNGTGPAKEQLSGFNRPSGKAAAAKSGESIRPMGWRQRTSSPEQAADGRTPLPGIRYAELGAGGRQRQLAAMKLIQRQAKESGEAGRNGDGVRAARSPQRFTGGAQSASPAPAQHSVRPPVKEKAEQLRTAWGRLASFRKRLESSFPAVAPIQPKGTIQEQPALPGITPLRPWLATYPLAHSTAHKGSQASSGKTDGPGSVRKEGPQASPNLPKAEASAARPPRFRLMEPSGHLIVARKQSRAAEAAAQRGALKPPAQRAQEQARSGSVFSGAAGASSQLRQPLRASQWTSKTPTTGEAASAARLVYQRASIGLESAAQSEQGTAAGAQPARSYQANNVANELNVAQTAAGIRALQSSQAAQAASVSSSSAGAAPVWQRGVARRPGMLVHPFTGGLPPFWRKQTAQASRSLRGSGSAADTPAASSPFASQHMGAMPGRRIALQTSQTVQALHNAIAARSARSLYETGPRMPSLTVKSRSFTGVPSGRAEQAEGGGLANPANRTERALSGRGELVHEPDRRQSGQPWLEALLGNRTGRTPTASVSETAGKRANARMQPAHSSGLAVRRRMATSALRPVQLIQPIAARTSAALNAANARGMAQIAQEPLVSSPAPLTTVARLPDLEAESAQQGLLASPAYSQLTVAARGDNGPIGRGGMPALAHTRPKQAASSEQAAPQVKVQAPQELDPAQLEKMIMKLPQFHPDAIANQVYKALERKMKLEQRRRGY